MNATVQPVLSAMPKNPKRTDVPVKLDAEVARISRIVAAYRGITLAEYISERLRPSAVEDLASHQNCPNTARGRKSRDA